MSSLGDVFEERLREIEVYLDFLEALDRQVQAGVPKLGGSPITAQQQKILYSAVYLQLYNLVESTITRCIDAVSAAAAGNGRWLPGDLSAELRREWVRVSARTHVNLTPEKRLRSTIQLCDFLVRALPLPEWRVERGQRGNWDDEEIQAIAERLGLDLQISKEVYVGIKQRIRDGHGSLSLVKDLRNRLAHGDLSFAECGDSVTVSDLRDLKHRTAAYLAEVIAAFRTYIDEYRFLLPERRPAVERMR